MEKEEENEEYVTITLEDETEMQCEVVGVFNALEREYIALLPKDKKDTIIYRYSENEDGESILDVINGDEEFNAVVKEFYNCF